MNASDISIRINLKTICRCPYTFILKNVMQKILDLLVHKICLVNLFSQEARTGELELLWWTII